MECRNCQTRNNKDAVYCMNCGKELKYKKEAATQSPPTTVIIQQETRRSVPGVIWMLGGTILALVLICMLVWLGVIDIPDSLRAQLPAPLADLVDGFGNANLPDPPGVEAPGDDEPPGDDGQDQAPGDNEPPGDDGQDQAPGQQPDQPPQPQPEPVRESCGEDLEAILRVFRTMELDYYVDFGHLAIDFNGNPEMMAYDVAITHNDTGIETSRATCDVTDFDYYVGDVYYDHSFLCGKPDEGIGPPFKWMAGSSTIKIMPVDEDCVLLELDMYDDCPSGQEFYPNWPHGNPPGCCTRGCYCQHPVTDQWGCWLTCAPACYD